MTCAYLVTHMYMSPCE